MRLYLDIETLPAIHWTPEQRLAHLRDSVPGQYKKPESIGQWLVDNQESNFRDTALDWRHGHLYCICAMLEEFTGELSVFTSANTEPGTLEGSRMLLEDLLTWLRSRQALNWKIEWVGWNSSSFDLPWLFYKSHQVGLTELAKALNPAPKGKYSRNWTDLMNVWCLDAWKEYAKLTDVASFLGIEEDLPGFDGSMVYYYWLAGKVDSIVEHCRSDVALLPKIAEKLL